ncbi:MAG TPA: hypothetical protein VIP46_13190 [Pyrinomonadaceae bacterium]
MKTRMKASLIVVALASLACLVWLVSRPGGSDEPAGASVSESSRGPSFEARVVMPRSARPLFGILPEWLVARLDGTPSELGFNHASSGAQVGSVGHDRIELRADGWELLIEADGEGRITSATRLAFPIRLAERQRSLRCRPADRATGHLHAAARADSGELDGSFLVELAACENSETGRAIEWPPAPLTLRGSFAGLPRGRR